MENPLRLERLSETNFGIFETLLCDTGEPGCFCSFWHGKWTMAEWKEREKCEPSKNRTTMLERIRAGYHVGVLAYEGDSCVGWISVGSLMDFFWTWRRLAQVGEDQARVTAAIPCINIASQFRGKGYQQRLLTALLPYAEQQGWKTIEGYPFDDEAFRKQGLALDWTGFASAYAKAGFVRIGAHWLSGPEYPRSIYRWNASS